MASSETSEVGRAEAIENNSNQSADRARKEAELRAISLKIEQRAGKGARHVTFLTPEASLRDYVDVYKKEIEKLGTTKFPKRSGKSVYGKVTMYLTIDAKGRVEQADVLESDDSYLAAHSKKLVSELPKIPFPPNFPEHTKRIIFLERFNYTRDDTSSR